MIRPGAMFKTLLSSVFRKPATENYPAVKTKMPEDFRGQIRFIASNCIGCKICMRDCPSDAIEIRKVGEKRFEAAFDLGRCLYCAQCVDSCPKSALETSGRFELAELSPHKLRVLFEAAPAAAGTQPQNPVPPPSSSPTQAPSRTDSHTQPQTTSPADSVPGSSKSV